jgi:hypothetical protein
MKQTAVEWLSQELDEFLFLFDDDWQQLNRIIEEAKEMEKEQIMDAYNNGDNRSAELYYNETYKKERQ